MFPLRRLRCAVLTSKQTINLFRVVAQLAERSFPIPEACRSYTVIGEIL